VYLTSGSVYRITTGAPLPLGADAIVPVEDTALLEEDEDVSARDVAKSWLRFALLVSYSFAFAAPEKDRHLPAESL